MKNAKNLSKSFDLGTAAVAFLIGFGTQVVFQFILSLFSLPAKTLTWIVVVANQVIFFAVALIFCLVPKRKVDPLAVTGAKQPPKWYFFPICILMAISCVTCFGPLSGLFARLLGKLGYNHTPQYFIPRDNAGLFALAFFALTLLPVLGEEFMVRGVLMSGAKKKSPLFAIFYTALIFALMHGNLNQLIHQFLLGIIMGYVAYLTGGIYASAMIHMTNNAMAMLLDYGFANNFVNHKFYYYIAGELGAVPTLVGVSLSFFALAMFLVLFTCLYHRNRARVKDFVPVLSFEEAEKESVPLEDAEEEEAPVKIGVRDRITAYLLFLSTPTVAAEEQARAEQNSKKAMDGNTRLLVIVLAAVLGAIVLLSLIPGGK